MRACSTASIVGVTIWFTGFGACSSCHANVAFMPGDAFFHAQLTSALVERFPANGSELILPYSHVSLSGGFGGHAGFEQIEITNVPSQMTAALSRLYGELRRDDAMVVRIDVDEEGNEIAREMNGFHLFVYNRDVKWRSQVIGLKYNEDWTDLPPQALLSTEDRPSGLARGPAVMYISFIDTYSAVVEDWKNARRFDPLTVDVPRGVPWGLTGPKITERASLDATDIQLIICPCDDLKLYFKKKSDLYFFSVTVDGVKRLTWTKEGLVSEDHDLAPGATGCLPISVGAGTEAIYDHVEFEYNRQGQLVWKKDQNGTIHEFDYDDLGRQTQDRVTTVGTGVDDAVLRIGKSYEVRGMVDTITSYDAATNGDTVNQVVFEYNDASLLSKEYQEHSGAKDANTPHVGYNHDTSASSGQFTKGLRPIALRYPNGRLVHYTYGSTGGTSDALSRIAAIKDDSGGSPGDSLAEYSYLAQNAIVQVDYPEPDLRYDLAHGTGNDPHDGPMDRFGRVTDLLWRNYGTSTDAVRIQHGYDRAGNRLYREDPVAAANGKDFDELYTYDGVNQLNTFQRGDLNANKDGLVGATKTFAQDWSLDPTGNWSTFKEDDDGDSTWDLNQSRTSNKSNEITDITETAGPAWATPAYNRAGNMTSIPSPNDATTVYTATYDAWNRLVKLEEGEDTLAEYAYDGRTFRTLKKTYAAGQLVETRHFHYNSGWQVLEERIGTSTHPDRHFIWGPRYIDDLILRDRDTSTPKNGTLNERLYSLQDPNWNVLALTTPNGAIQERHAYTAYGTPEHLTPAFGSVGSSNHAWETLYTGYRYDGEAQMYQVRNRVLRPGLGWVQRDPIGYGDGFHVYQYVGGSPVARTDPSGKTCTCPGTKWTFAGMTGGLTFIGGYAYARATAMCTKAELRAYRVYSCGKGCGFRKPIHCYCEAKLGMHIGCVGIEGGIGVSAIFGNFIAATDDEIEQEATGIGWSWEANLGGGVEAGGDFSGDPSGDWGGGGFGTVGVGVSIDYIWVNVRSSGLKCVREALTKDEKDMVRNLGPCTHKDERIKPPTIVSNPYATRPPGTTTAEAAEAGLER